MKKTTLVILSLVGIFCMILSLSPQVVYSDASNQELEQRLERLEKHVGTEEEGSEAGEKSVLDRLTIGGVMAGAYQYQNVSNAPDTSDTGRGGFVFQPELGIALSEYDEIVTKFQFAAGNGLNAVSPFIYTPWGTDLEDDVKDINGRNRDYLLTASYKHTFAFSDGHTLGMTGGLIDSTDYLDENAFANDEFTQFMNEVFVNAPVAFLPSYDIGGALEWEYGNFAFKGVVMNVGENDYGRSYNYFGGTVGYTLDTGLGEGNYRVTGGYTTKDFDDPDGESKKYLGSAVLSFDQQLGEILGAWVRFGWQDDDAAVAAKYLYSGGIDIGGNLWGREGDNAGVAYAYLNDGNADDIDNSQVFEAYVRFSLLEFLAVTADVQYMKDDYKAGDNPKGFIYGVRGVVEF